MFDRALGKYNRKEYSKIHSLPDLSFLPEPLEPPGFVPQNAHLSNGMQNVVEKSKQLLSRWKSQRADTSNRVSDSWDELASDKVLKLSRWRHKPLVVSFGQPWSSHRAVLTAKLAMPKIRWIAHFSDPWSDNPYLSDEGSDAKRMAKEEEKSVIQNADLVLFVSEASAQLVMGKYPREWYQKVRVIPHLCDISLTKYGEVKSVKSGNRLRIVHAGSLYSGLRAPLGLFDAVHDMRERGELTDKLEIRFVGEMPDALVQRLKDLGIEKHISSTGQLYYGPSLQEIASADATIVIDANMDPSPFLPSKIFDYLIFDKPIIGLTPRQSPTHCLLKELGYPAFEPDDAKGISRHLQRLSEGFSSNSLKASDEHLNARKRFDVLGPYGDLYSNIFLELLQQR